MTYNPKSFRNFKLNNPHNPKPRINAVSCHRLLLSILDGATSYQIVEETGLSYTSVRNYINALHIPAEGVNLVYISDWLYDANKRPTRPVYTWGPGKEDVKRKSKSPLEKSKQYRRMKLERLALHGITPGPNLS